MIWSLYHLVVRRRVLSLFAAINRGDPGPVVGQFARKHEHIFIGHHALGGRRTSLARTKDWYDRLFRLLPDIRFDIHRLDVRGPPWATAITVEWTETNSGTDGVRTQNPGVHLAELKWGRMTRLYILTDTSGLVQTLKREAATGVAEAIAEPITG